MSGYFKTVIRVHLFKLVFWQ